MLTEKQLRQKIIKLEKELKEKSLHSNDEIDSLQTQLKMIQKQYDQLNTEHSKAMEKIDQNNNRINENEQHLQDEIQRLRRDLGLELYRKQDAEKKARSFEDKFRHEQTQLQKVQYDYTQTKHDLKTLQAKYDALQLELIDMHKIVKTNSNLTLDTKVSTTSVQQEERPTRGKRRTNDENHFEQEAKKPKRETRSRSTASSNNTSLNTYQQDEQENGKRPKRTTRNGSNASASTAIPILIKQTKKKSSNVRFDFNSKK